MISLQEGIRVTQNVEKRKENKYILYNSQNGEKYIINNMYYWLLIEINKGKICSEHDLNKLLESFFGENDVKKAKKELFEEKIIRETDFFKPNENILSKLNNKYPLTSLAIELTSACNLRCKHCYGQFGECDSKRFWSYSDIVALMFDLNRLHTKNVALTGGEAFVHPEFEKIAELFLVNGFDLTIFTNGYCYEKIKKFVLKNKRYRMRIKVSLDGFESTHNKIRGITDAYEKTMKTISFLDSAENIETSISTTIMEDNLAEMPEFDYYIKNKFPNMQHLYDLAFPVTDAFENQQGAISIKELDRVHDSFPQYFEYLNEFRNVRTFRCSGGISSAAIDVNGNIRICTGAQDDRFIIGSLRKKTLYDNWLYPNENGKYYRNEKHKHSKKCESCKNAKTCQKVDCRLLAYKYTGNEKNVNPMTCYIESMRQRNR